MPAIIPNYEYDIFVSYRQNDNKSDKWVTNFVEALKEELEATLKNPVSIYFDENPHDGLLETHDVDRSLEKKLKCLVFIPIISQTYCDESSFAWQHEFLPFIKMAKEDELGMNITLRNGNVANRVLPVKIHDLDEDDQKVVEKELGGPLRSINFIYKQSGVNRPLNPDDNEEKNLNKTRYKNQINKVANTLKDIGISIVRQTQGKIPKSKTMLEPASTNRLSNRRIYTGVTAFILLLLMYLGYTRIYNPQQEVVENKTIAVLPFSNTNPSTETDYLGFAIADQIIGDLVYLKNVTVRLSGSIRKYDKQAIDPIIVGDDLKVDYVLIGNYLKQANIIRLNIELINVNTNEIIWREPIEVDYHDAFDLQDIVARKVVEGLNVKFTQKELNRIGKDIPDNPLAYEYYLRSISYPLSNEGDQLAIEMLNKSIELDSNYAPSYAQLGDRMHRLAQYKLLNPEETKRAENSFIKALSLNEELIYALANLAAIYTETARTEKAVEHLRQILEINPNYSEAHFYLGYSYRYAGMNNEAILEMEKAIALDPENPTFRSIIITYTFAGEYEKAFEAVKLFKESDFTLALHGMALFRQGKQKQALEYFDSVIDMEPDGLMARVVIGVKAAIEGNLEEGLKAARKFEQYDILDAEAWCFFASNYALLGDRDGCIRCLRRAVDGGFFNYPFMLTDSFLDSVRDDPEFQEILGEAKEKHLAFRQRFF